MNINSTSRRPLAALTLATAIAATACGDAGPMALDEPVPNAALEVPTPTLALSAETVTELRAVVDDASGRLIPGLDDPAAEPLRAALLQVSASVRGGDRGALVAALATARQRLDALDDARDEDAESSALRLALTAIERTALGAR